jgi:hypothetical protein
MQSTDEQRGSERRRHRRHAIRAVGTINYGRARIPCILMNLSRSGAQIRLLDGDDALPRGLVTLEVRSIGLMSVNVVWQKGAFAGLKFAAEIELNPPAQAQAA